MNSSDFNRFATNPVNLDISRSMFNQKHTVKFSGNVGDVIPFEVREVLPGDTFNYKTTKIIRLQPLVAPIMDEVILDTYYFFVPNRLVWNHWVNFMGENTSSAWTPAVEYSIPKIEIPEDGYNVGTIADYMGVPTGTGSGFEISALPFRAYALICDQWFRDENLMTPVHVYLDDTTRTGSNGSDQVTDIEKGGKPFVAAKFHDFFTSALPGAQKGQPVNVSLLGGAPVYSMDAEHTKVGEILGGASGRVFNLGSMSAQDAPLQFLIRNSSTGKASVGSSNLGLINVPNASQRYQLDGTSTSSSPSSGIQFYPNNLWADLTDISAFTINDLRIAFACQKYLERLARGGSRYIEFIKSFYNVDSPDARLQRTEYLGGSRVSLNVNSVNQTSATMEDTTPQAHPAGISVTGEQNSDFVKSFTEHGYVIGVAVARYHHSYSQGLERHWLRDTVYQFYNPVFANIGEQYIPNCMLWLGDVEDSSNSQAFGFQEAWAEYRYAENKITGQLRPTADYGLSCYHLGDYYDERPSLSASWVREDKNNLDRCLAVTSAVANQFWCDFLIENDCARPLPLYSIPGLVDHH